MKMKEIREEDFKRYMKTSISTRDVPLPETHTPKEFFRYIFDCAYDLAWETSHQNCADIANAIDSGRGNEKLIVESILKAKEGKNG